jgi:hypothetical protein
VNDDVKRAAERIRRITDGEDLVSVYDPQKPANQVGDSWGHWDKVDAAKSGVECDCETLADAYLDEHPADEDEPITEEWLKSIGFRQWSSDEDDEFELYIPMHDEICWECRLAYQANGFYAVRMCDQEDVGRELASESVELLGTRNMNHTVVRGDLYRLAAALRLNLEWETYGGDAGFMRS